MSRCEYCDGKLDSIPIICPECGKSFCSAHKLPEDHGCSSLKKTKVKKTEKTIDQEDKTPADKKNYIEEEVKVVKRKVRNETSTVKFFRFIINHHMLILIIALLITGFYVQTQDIYDLKGKSIEVFGALKSMVSEEESVPAYESNTSIESINDSENSHEVLEDKRTLIQKIQDTPSLYVNTEVEIEGFVEWKELKYNDLEFQYVVYDENRRYIPFLFTTQNIGFNKYSKYKIYGIVKKEDGKVYIDSHDTERFE